MRSFYCNFSLGTSVTKKANQGNESRADYLADTLEIEQDKIKLIEEKKRIYTSWLLYDVVFSLKAKLNPIGL